MISGVIPQTGRTCSASLSRLSDVTGSDLSDLIRVLETSKSHGTPSLVSAQEYLAQFQNQGLPVTLQPDRKREDRPFRLSLLGFDTSIAGVTVRIEGAEPHNCSSLIRLAEADFAIVGFDELLATMQTYLGINSRYVTMWGNFNAELAAPTDVRIAGSANLKYADEETGRKFQDFDGFFLMGNKRWGYDHVNRMLANGK